MSSAAGEVETSTTVDGAGSSKASSQLVIETSATRVALLPLPAERRGGATVRGTVGGDAPAGTLVIAEGGAAPALFPAFCQNQSHEVASSRMTSQEPLSETPEFVGLRPFGAQGAF
ncbi:MAG: hypothetical protein KC486_18060 [Myxococcales bacterium]|nr:hypothetical protein [Myxococcales bacterium]